MNVLEKILEEIEEGDIEVAAGHKIVKEVCEELKEE